MELDGIWVALGLVWGAAKIADAIKYWADKGERNEP